ncbi:unnamed protein product [Paramecium sonneborni]|uniref:FHA domain-containing protein n=1 Tax=Paramecium sonneborni TaxID=65129 RepID=A0A8S1RSW9_9CILI|nr:unnamed protein product [Paramecium sonneborni]
MRKKILNKANSYRFAYGLDSLLKRILGYLQDNSNEKDLEIQLNTKGKEIDIEQRQIIIENENKELKRIEYVYLFLNVYKKQQIGILIEQDLEKFVSKKDHKLISIVLKSQEVKLGDIQAIKFQYWRRAFSIFHAEVIYQNEEFYINDIGSTTGIFITVETNNNCKLEWLLNQVAINLKFNKRIEMVLIQMTNTPEKHVINLTPQKSVTTVGRQQTANLTFSEDHHLSNIHAKICLIDGRVYLEDMGSKFISWLRLSREGQPSQLYPLSNQTVLKIGTTSTYLCKRNTQLVVEIVINYNFYIIYQCLLNLIYIERQFKIS